MEYKGYLIEEDRTGNVHSYISAWQDKKPSFGYA